MHHVTWGASALEYFPCRHGQSRLLFRGPKKRFENRHIVVLGGSRTYGKFVAAPYADLLKDGVGCQVVNLGCLNAGLDAFALDETLISIGRRADLVVLEIQAAIDITNRFYAVHPRRNDRFLQASKMMERLFPAADFTEFNFTRHMLKTLQKQWPDRIGLMMEDLQQSWVSRMGRLLDDLNGNVVLLWLADSTPPLAALDVDHAPEGVNRRMIEAVRAKAADYVEVVISDEIRNLGTEGMHYLPHEAEMAAAMPGPVVHQSVAAALEPVLDRHLSHKRKRPA